MLVALSRKKMLELMSDPDFVERLNRAESGDEVEQLVMEYQSKLKEAS